MRCLNKKQCHSVASVCIIGSSLATFKIINLFHRPLSFPWPGAIAPHQPCPCPSFVNGHSSHVPTHVFTAQSLFKWRYLSFSLGSNSQKPNGGDRGDWILVGSVLCHTAAAAAAFITSRWRRCYKVFNVLSCRTLLPPRKQGTRNSRLVVRQTTQTVAAAAVETHLSIAPPDRECDRIYFVRFVSQYVLVIFFLLSPTHPSIALFPFTFNKFHFTTIGSILDGCFRPSPPSSPFPLPFAEL